MKDYLKIIDEHKDNLIEDLSKLISYDSVAGKREGDYPFGQKVQKAFEEILSMGKRDGFDVKNVDNYGGHIEFKGQGDGVFALLGHIDIVPAGSGWDTDPFVAQVIDGKLFGRGAIDDKGPTIAGYYAMKALKEAGFEPKKDIRLIIGLDEETNWDGIKYYIEKEELPKVMGFAPDASFPVIHCEKGLMIFKLRKKLESSKTDKELKLISCKGGNAPNMVADKLIAKIYGQDISEQVLEYAKEKGYKIENTYENNINNIKVKGVSAHGAMPEKGVNAISIFFDFAGRLDLDKQTKDIVKFYNNKIGFNFHGENFGCNFEDEPSGKLNFNVGMLEIDEENFELVINIRYPATMREEEIYQGIEKEISGFEIENMDHLAPLYVPKDSPLVNTLMNVYKDFTGDEDCEPLVIGGATYARTIPNCVAFGALFPNEEEVEHQPNEYVNIDSLILATKIYAKAIYELCK